MITESVVRTALNTIVDPCSRTAGCPAGLDEMGLVRAVEIRNSAAGAEVRVVIGVTEFGCLMSVPFATEAYKRLYGLPGVSVVIVELDRAFDWDADDMSPEYQQRLRAHRARRQLEIPLVPRRSPAKDCAVTTTASERETSQV